MITKIVFSKDRACQLQALLDSWKLQYDKELKDIYVIYTHSSESYKKGYDIIQERFPQVHWIKQGVFQSDVLSTTMTTDGEFVQYFVDDNIFVNPFTVSPEQIEKTFEDKSVISISLRLGLNVNYCYPINEMVQTPKKTTFRWKSYHGDFCYPMSLDGSIFRKSDLKDILLSTGYGIPNDLEAALNAHKNNIGRDNIVMLEKSSVIGLVVNRVQDVYKNRHAMSWPADVLNHLYVDDNKIIDIIPYQYQDYNSPHVEREIYFKWSS